MGINISDVAREVVETERRELERFANSLGPDFDEIVSRLAQVKGHLFITGMGKSGLVGQKIAATLASTGTPSIFMHPGEAFHGDLGMVTEDDAFLAISYSGNTEEVIRLLPFLKANGNLVVGISGNPDSILARQSDQHISVHVDQEACPLRLAPTSSTTVTMVLGDAIAVALMRLKAFTAEDFARFHPGGSLGRKLLLRVEDAMHTELPSVGLNASFREVLQGLSSGTGGATLVMDGDELKGIVTDGDIRRFVLAEGSLDAAVAQDLMTPNPICLEKGTMLGEAEEIMKHRRVTFLVVIDEAAVPIGFIKIHDI